ncbi:RPAP1-like protein [Aspergillus karnatakaensis]|uniref:RPAP1 family protein n=1 Tax=Aspergillus karnatakaensis TaxID=1810916 RepID=UPI003CCCD574
MALQGERFTVDLDSDTEDQTPYATSTLAIPGVIGEIQERTPPAAPPAPPTLKSASGFPLHRRRVKQSAFKQRQSQSKPGDIEVKKASSDIQDERTAIEEQNRQQLASMSDAQIRHERDELISSIDPSLLERFLRRARIDDGDITPSSSRAPSKDDTQSPARASNLEPSPAFMPQPKHSTKATNSQPSRDELPPPKIPEDLHPATEFPPSGSVHFPTPPPRTTPMPSLDPSSPDFLSDLQTHYFPNISHDPSTLSWLQPPSSEPDEPGAPPSSAYHPGSSAEAVHPASLRFSLIGTVLSPTTSLSLPTNLGLHHHGNDPHAAGYTIPELAILSRSSFPAQRCIAWQVLGRILFRLGQGQFGERGSTLVEGLWSVIEREGVVAGMLEEAGSSTSIPSAPLRRAGAGAEPGEQDSFAATSSSVGRHASASAWAVEGVWLWQSGGSGDRGVLKPGATRAQ